MATIHVDQNLITQAMHETGFATEDAVVEAGLRLLVQMRTQERLRALRGTVRWDGDLDSQRLNDTEL